jgi:hypothetical protein
MTMKEADATGTCIYSNTEKGTLINCNQEKHIYCTGNMERKKACLMANIPEDLICRGIKDMMKSHSQLHHPQARP